MDKKNVNCLAMGLLTLALFFSGFFVILTPLPLFYALARGRDRALVGVLLPTALVVAALYAFAVMPVEAFYASHPGWGWVFPIPGMALLEVSSSQSVAFFGIGYYLFFVVIALTAFQFFSKKESFARLALYAVLITGGVGLSFYLYTIFYDQSPFGLIRAYYDAVVADFLKIQAAQPGMAPDQVVFFEKHTPSVITYLVLISPALLFTFVFLSCVVNFMLINRFFLAFLPNMQAKQGIGEWKLPFGLVWVVIGLTSLLLSTFYGLSADIPRSVSINGLLMLGLLYYLQGLAIVAFFLEQKKVRPLIRLFVFFTLIIFIQPLGFAVIGLGFFDSWWNVRKIGSK